MATSTIKFEKKYMIPDYSAPQTVSSTPFTAPTAGIISYIVGDGNAGARGITINGTAVASASLVSGVRTTLTAIMDEGDILNIPNGKWGDLYFFPFK